MEFGQWVKSYREGVLATSRVKCALRAGVTPQVWGRMEKETGNPRESTIKKVALAFDLSPEQVWTLSGLKERVPDADAEMSAWIAYTTAKVPAARREEFRSMVSGIANVLSAA